MILQFPMKMTLLALVLIQVALPLIAQESLLQNGDFSTLNAKGFPESWKLVGSFNQMDSTGSVLFEACPGDTTEPIWAHFKDDSSEKFFILNQGIQAMESGRISFKIHAAVMGDFGLSVKPSEIEEGKTSKSHAFSMKFNQSGNYFLVGSDGKSKSKRKSQITIGKTYHLFVEFEGKPEGIQVRWGGYEGGVSEIWGESLLASDSVASMRAIEFRSYSIGAPMEFYLAKVELTPLVK